MKRYLFFMSLALLGPYQVCLMLAFYFQKVSFSSLNSYVQIIVIMTTISFLIFEVFRMLRIKLVFKEKDVGIVSGIVISAMLGLPAVLGSGHFSWIVFTIAIFLILSGIFLRYYSIKSLARSFSHAISIKTEHELILSGPFSYIRHPIYVASFLFISGVILIFHAYYLLFLFIALVPLGLLRILNEERQLRDHFGDQYDLYCCRVKRFIPYLM